MTERAKISSFIEVADPQLPLTDEVATDATSQEKSSKKNKQARLSLRKERGLRFYDELDHPELDRS